MFCLSYVLLAQPRHGWRVFDCIRETGKQRRAFPVRRMFKIKFMLPNVCVCVCVQSERERNIVGVVPPTSINLTGLKLCKLKGSSYNVFAVSQGIYIRAGRAKNNHNDILQDLILNHETPPNTATLVPLSARLKIEPDQK